MKLLIVDDNAAVRRLIGSIVLPFGEIRECADGAQALSAYLAQRPDVVLMDIRMNEVDGIQAARQIKTADPSARILMVTNYEDDALRQASLRAGACGYVLKDNLLDLVRLLEAMEPANPGPPRTELWGTGL